MTETRSRRFGERTTQSPSRQLQPHSVLARRLGPWAVAYIDPIARALTPAKRDVLRRLLEGKSPAEIASETNRALATVQTQIKSVRLACAATSERQLFAECHRRGIGAPSWALAAPPEALSQSRRVGTRLK
ncbi:MAG: hypothetical protein M3O36_10640 [Myxococcota bacterium]|nr:hypothetical protein [Myxococcota bacterium]